MVIKDRPTRFHFRAIFGRKASTFVMLGVCSLLGLGAAGWFAKAYAFETALGWYWWVLNMTYATSLESAAFAFPETARKAPGRYVHALLHREDVPRLRLDVKFKHWQKILRNREEALERDAILLDDDDEVPAIVSVGDQAHKAKIRLKGDMVDHLRGGQPWSLRVDSKGALFGMRRFSLNRLGTRAYAAGPLFLKYMDSIGIIAPRYRMVHVSLNGTDWGLMELEEHVGTELLEARGRKDGVIGVLDDRAFWAHHAANSTGGRGVSPGPYQNYWTTEFRAYRRAKLEEDPRTANNLVLAEALLAAYQDGALPPSSVFDLEQFARYLVAEAIWGEFHSLGWQNVRLYLNPFTLKLEPIAGDIQYSFQPLHAARISPKLLVSGFMHDPAFRDALSRAVPEVTALMLKGGLLRDLDHERERIEAILRRSSPFLAELDLSVLRDNAALLAAYGSAFFPENGGFQSDRPALDDDYASHVLVRIYDRPNRQIAIYNRLHLPVAVERAVATCAEPADSELAGIDDPVAYLTPAHFSSGAAITGAPAEAALRTVDIELLSDTVIDATPVGDRGTRLELSLPRGMVPKTCGVKVTTRRPGTDEVRTATAAAPLAHLERHPLDVVGSPSEIAGAQRWLRWNEASGRFEGLTGAWSVDRPVILPAGLHMAAGTTLAFAPGAYLVVRGPLDIAGTPSRPVVLRAQDPAHPWKGIYVMAGPSRWQHVEVRDTAALEDGYLMLTGAVTFHHSDVRMTDVTFDGMTAEDALNIIHAHVELEGLTVQRTRSDGFDCDFCDGTIARARFHDVGGDGLDVSGTRAVVETIEARNVRDKAISVGEDSELVVIRDLIAHDVGTAVASKDRSRTVVEGAEVRAARFAGLMSYVKKPAFGPARLEATSVVFGDDVARPALAQLGSQMVLNGTRIEETDLDVEALYREGPMVK